MDRNQFDEHTIWPVLDNLKEMLGGDLSGDVDKGRSEIRLVHAVVQYVDALRGLDPALVDENSLTAMGNDLTNGRDYLTSYLDDREANTGMLTSNAATAFLGVRATAIQSMPSPPANEQARAAQEATERYKEAADAEIDTLRKQVEGLKARIGEVDDERTADAEAAQTSLASLQEKIAEGEQTVATQTTQLQEQIETQRTSFTEEVEQRETAFKASEATRETSAEEQRTEQADRAGKVLADLTTYREQAKDLLDATARDLVSGDYRGWATKQARSAFWWTVVTVLIGLITVASLVVVVTTASGDSVQFLLSKSSVGIIGLILAGYTARQAAEHRLEERTANRLALDLAALEPFLEHVENPDELRKQIAERVFVPERTQAEEGRFAFGRRGMSLAELSEFVKVIRNPPE